MFCEGSRLHEVGTAFAENKYLELGVQKTSIKQNDSVFVFVYHLAPKEGIIATGIAVSNSDGTDKQKSVLVRLDQMVDPINVLSENKLKDNSPPLHRFLMHDDNGKPRKYASRFRMNRPSRDVRHSALEITKAVDEFNRVWNKHYTQYTKLD